MGIKQEYVFSETGVKTVEIDTEAEAREKLVKKINKTVFRLPIAIILGLSGLFGLINGLISFDVWTSIIGIIVLGFAILFWKI